MAWSVKGVEPTSSAQTRLSSATEMMSFRREAGQRAGKIMRGAECKVVIVQAIVEKRRGVQCNLRTDRTEEEICAYCILVLRVE